MIDKDELCKQIRMIYPDIVACGIDLTVDYDGQQLRWTVILRKDQKELRTYLEPGDAENCMMGRQCLSLAIEIGQLKDSIERMPERMANGPNSNDHKKDPAPIAPVCEKAPDFAEHYRLKDDDIPCDDGRSGRV